MATTDRAVGLWPRLVFAELKDTVHLVHMWTQVVGKIRLAMTPLMNHWWNSTLMVTPRGLTTTLIDRFRAGFLGKASPVQFFWGGFDLASARFSGRRGPAYEDLGKWDRPLLEERPRCNCVSVP
jgi:hypothetical protein